MAIKFSEHAESEDLQAGQPGTMSVTTITCYVAPCPLVLKGMIARAGTAGTTGTSNTDIRKNGTSVFASGAAGIQFATTVATPTYGALAAANPATFAKGDVITVVNTVVHTTPIQNLAIGLLFQRPRNSGVVAATILDGFGVANE